MSDSPTHDMFGSTDDQAASESRCLRSAASEPVPAAPNPFVAAAAGHGACRPREYVLVKGDKVLVDNEEFPGGLTGIAGFDTLAGLTRELVRWVKERCEEAREEARPKILELLRGGKPAAAATLMCESAGRWWYCYHPDLGEGPWLLGEDPESAAAESAES